MGPPLLQIALMSNKAGIPEKNLTEAERIVEDAEGGVRRVEIGAGRWLTPTIAALWSIFQLLLPRVILLNSTVVRSIHLSFAIVLVFLTHPMLKKPRKGKLGAYLGARDRITTLDYAMALIAGLAALYIAFELFMLKINPDYYGIASRQGRPIARDIVFGITLTLMLLEAARRSLGPMLTVVVSVFILYSFFSEYMPAGLDFRGVTLSKFVSKITMSTEGIYGIPLYVSANIVFLFVLFGVLLEKAGAGKYFVDLAFSLMGRFRGGPAKAAVLASGLTGMVSGSSIANTVTTGTFTIPLMKKVGYPDYKAGAVEVAVSTNGQLMPPIMGAAAFIIAETVNIPYVEVIRAAFIPAIISYIALLYIVHLEALKLGIRGISKSELPEFWPTLIGGLHYLIPLTFLIVSLVVFRTSPALAVFRAIIAQTILMALENLWRVHRNGTGLKTGWKGALRRTLFQIRDVLISGGKNMMGIGVAVAAAGIIVGVVTFGLGGIITEAIEILSGGRFFLILIITAIASLILGMGLPTTATYIVMAALTAPVIVTLGAKSGVVFPLIAAHLFVFFFGILADDTPPVGLAAYAASAIAKSNPIKTGVQGFYYDIRTAILPFIFMFNTDLLLYEISNPLYAMWVFITTTFAMLAFASLTQGYIIVSIKWWEYVLLVGISFGLLMPSFVAEKLLNRFIPWLGEGRGGTILVGAVLLTMFGLLYLRQKVRSREYKRTTDIV